MQYLFTDSLTVISLTAGAVVTALILIIFYRGFILRSLSNKNTLAGNSLKTTTSYPPISIIIYDREATSALDRLLNDIFSQQYDGAYEVIVVSDGNSLETTDIVKRVSLTHHNLRMTFVPQQARMPGSKKLAITLGVKGATYEHIIVTDSACQIPSTAWLKSYSERFANGASLIIGLTSPCSDEGKRLKPWQSFDIMVETIMSLSAAKRQRPYRADIANIGFTRQLFDAHGGFTGSVGSRRGEDDIFISAIANDAVTTTLLDNDTILSVTRGDSRLIYKYNKITHIFNRQHRHKIIPDNNHLPAGRLQSALMGFYSLMMWTSLALSVAAIIISNGNLITTAIVVVAEIAWIVTVTVAWRRISRCLGHNVNTLLLPVMIFVRPIHNFIYKLRVRLAVKHL